MSTHEPDYSLSEVIVLDSEERERLVIAIDALLPLLGNEPRLSRAFSSELEAARLLASGGCYHYDSITALLAKQMFHLATLDLSPEVKEKVGEVLKAHLDVRISR